MALRGEGDPRWVVKERQDGRNVNGWHWEDKDVTKWAEHRLKQLISSDNCSASEPSPHGVHVLSLDTVDGDATLYNRKGVLKVLYDLKLSGKWASADQKDPFNETKDSDKDKEKAKQDEKNRVPNGEFKIELFDDDPEVIVSVDNKCTAPDASAFKSAFQKQVSPKIAKHCRTFIEELHEGADQFIDGLTVPKAKPGTNNVGQSVTKSRTEVTGNKSNINSSSSSSGKKSSTRISMTEVFTCSTNDWILALTDQARLSAITRNKATVDPNPGGKWEVMNGLATGEVISITQGEQFCMKWKLSSWGKKEELEKMDFATVECSVVDKEGRTEATVVVSGIPKGTESQTEGFWRIQILQAMRIVMGWGDASKFAGM